MNDRKTRLILFLIVLLVAGGGLWYAWAYRSAPEPPRLSVRQAEVLPSSEFVNARASIDHYRERILREPEAIRNYVELAQVYLQQARATAEETRYVPLAQDLIEEALRRDPAHYHARVLKASLLNVLHRFEEARTLAEALIAEHPRHAFTHGILVDALVELGAYEAAVAACDRMLSLRPGLPSYARAAYLRELHGDTQGAIAAMTLAADAGVAGSRNRAWTLYQLGQLYLGSGDAKIAAALFEGILEERPHDAYAVGGLGHVRLVEGAYADAIALLTEAYELAPSPDFLGLLAEAYAAAGDDGRRAETLARIQQDLLDAEAMGENVRMEYADFLADEDTMLEEALRLARLEYERRPDHLHALETYAWALYKNGQAEAAVPHIERAMRLGTGDAMVLYRAGLIYRAAGQADAARTHLERALENHLHAESPTAARDARAALGRLAAT